MYCLSISCSFCWPLVCLTTDNPLVPEGVKTEESDKRVTGQFVNKHLEIGIDALLELESSGDSVKHLRFE